MTPLRVDAVDAFNDNYIWILDDGTDAVVVDPGQSAPVFAYLDRHKLRLAAILLTHHHADHIGGVGSLLDGDELPVFGPPDPRMAVVNRPCHHGDRVQLERPSLHFDVIETPGHTTSHIAFHGHGRLFCGDTLFSVGCGRLFEGTPAQMQQSLDRLAALPDDTAVHCAHEYTEANCALRPRSSIPAIGR
jgi:hydroxyacylglutathione hydrolase